MLPTRYLFFLFLYSSSLIGCFTHFVFHPLGGYEFKPHHGESQSLMIIDLRYYNIGERQRSRERDQALKPRVAKGLHSQYL